MNTLINKYFTTAFGRLRFFMSATSLGLVLLSCSFIGWQGFNLGQDFTGGVVVEAQVDPQLSLEDLNRHLDTQLGQDVQLVQGSEMGHWQLRYNHHGIEHMPIAEVLATFSDNVLITSSSIVGPQVGQDMVEQGGLAIMTCLLLTLAYLSIRFDWRLATGALVALSCDIIIVLGVFAALQLEFNLTVLAAVLAVLGYSLNDSIIIADRVRELMRARANGQSETIINDAVKSTFSRTMVTSGTTLATVTCLWLLGGDSLQGFAIALMVGIVCGTWSSIALGVTLPQLLNISPQHYQVIDYSDDALNP
ncbi:protein translocase subunit SecF [Shewanella maritima]|uniref:protein translocase subunit SecF n=1 Tax=Shewanella maritima TaxID=2520507 RepID=UPI003736B459